MSASSSAGVTETTAPKPPVARRDEDAVVYAGTAPPGWDPKLPRQSEASGNELLDPPVKIPNPYHWMRDKDRKDPQVLDHLKAENAYTEAITKHLEPLRGELYKEMLQSIQETDYTTPRPHGDFFYYTRTQEGKSYTIHCRAPKTPDAALKVEWNGSVDSPILPGEQILLDVNELAKDKPYCSTGAVKKSPSHSLLAYSVDFSGDETCQMYVKDANTHEIVDHDPELEISGSIAWGADDKVLYYLKLDETHRPYQVYRRFLGTDDKSDELIFEEPDDLYWTGIYKSLDGKYLFVEASSKETSEIHFLDLQDPNAALQCIAKRTPKVLYEVEHCNGQWWISSNIGGLPNMALFTTPAVADSQEQWTLVKDTNGNVVFPGQYDRSLDGVTCFSGHVVASGREGGLPRVWIMGGIETGSDGTTVKNIERLSFEENAYDVGLGAHYEFDTHKVVVTYDSLVTPPQSIEIDMNDVSERTVLKSKNVPGYDKSLYACDRITVTSRDGKTKIPVSLVYRKDTMEKHESSGEPAYVHLYGYGSYGACIEADFRATRLPLLNRGIVYVIAHIRGGGEMGRQWYEEPNGAKYLCKKNTFNDFVDVARWLVDDRKLTSPDKLSCEGRSAGGMLIGSTLNQAPELFKVAIAGVPFVDVVCTMTDASIPLTAMEWEEWGNPNEAKFHEYMMEYCPMQNVRNAKYPSCLLTGGLHDPRVQYWEVSKFAATLRHAQDPSSGPVCVKMDMSAGHFSASDRYKYLKELSFDYGFLLDQLGLVG